MSEDSDSLMHSHHDDGSIQEPKDINKSENNKWADDAKSKFVNLLLEYKLTLLAWLSMALAILSGSAIGPIFKYMEEEGIQALIGMLLC
jgi:hypothetical protein